MLLAKVFRAENGIWLLTSIINFTGIDPQYLHSEYSLIMLLKFTGLMNILYYQRIMYRQKLCTKLAGTELEKSLSNGE